MSAWWHRVARASAFLPRPSHFLLTLGSLLRAAAAPCAAAKQGSSHQAELKGGQELGAFGAKPATSDKVTLLQALCQPALLPRPPLAPLARGGTPSSAQLGGFGFDSLWHNQKAL